MSHQTETSLVSFLHTNCVRSYFICPQEGSRRQREEVNGSHQSCFMQAFKSFFHQGEAFLRSPCYTMPDHTLIASVIVVHPEVSPQRIMELRVLSSAWKPALRKVLLVPDFFHLISTETPVLLKAFKLHIYLCSHPLISTILSLSAAGYSFLPQFILFSFFWDLIYRPMCDFPHQAQSVDFSTVGLQSRCRNISKMITRNGKTLELNVSIRMSMGFFIFVLFDNFAHFSEILFHVVIIGIECRLIRENIYFNKFSIQLH